MLAIKTNFRYNTRYSLNNFKDLIAKINVEYSHIDNHLLSTLENDESLLSFSKWGSFLPMKYKCEILKERYFDFESAISFINNLNPKVME